MTEIIRSLLVLVLSVTFVGTLRSLRLAPTKASRVGRIALAWFTGTILVSEILRLHAPLTYVTYSFTIGGAIGVYFCYLTFHDSYIGKGD
jgi:hypothetical protein